MSFVLDLARRSLMLLPLGSHKCSMRLSLGNAIGTVFVKPSRWLDRM